MHSLSLYFFIYLSEIIGFKYYSAKEASYCSAVNNASYSAMSATFILHIQASYGASLTYSGSSSNFSSFASTTSPDKGANNSEATFEDSITPKSTSLVNSSSTSGTSTYRTSPSWS